MRKAKAAVQQKRQRQRVGEGAIAHVQDLKRGTLLGNDGKSVVRDA